MDQEWTTTPTADGAGGSGGGARGSRGPSRGSRGSRGPSRGSRGSRARGSRGARGSRRRAQGGGQLGVGPILPAQADATLCDALEKVRKGRATDKKNLSFLSVEQKTRYAELREQKQIGRFLLPDAPERKRRRKAASPERMSCPLLLGTPTTLPPRKMRHWEVEAGPSREAVPVPVEVTPTGKGKGKGKGKAAPTKLQFSPAAGVHSVVEVESVEPVDADYHTVDVDIDFIGFTPTSSLGPRHSAVGSSPTASTSFVTNDTPVVLFEDVEDEIAGWERSIVGDSGSDLEEGDLPDMDAGIDIAIPRQGYDADFSAGPDDLTPDLVDQMGVLDARDDSALRDYVSSEDMLNFQWHCDATTFTGQREVFTGLSGPTFVTDGMTPLDIFERIWDEGFINHIVAATNRYANHLFVDAVFLRQSRMKKWTDVTPGDIWTFFGILMLQSFVLNPVERDYWYPRFPYLRIGNFKDIMPYGKFLLIKKCMQFVDNSSVPANSKLAKISPVIDHLNRKFSSLYLPEQNIALDESLLLWKGRLSFVQLIANKAARVGIKSYELCESRTGYLWKFEIYAGKENQHQLSEGHDVERGSNEPDGASSQIVYRLVRPLLNKGHTLVMDSFYNSPLLSRTLKAQKTDTIGTLRLNREFVPDSLRNKTKNNMRPGEIVFSHTKDLSILVWRDSNLVSLISTYHKVEVSGAEKFGVYKYKPKVVLDYNLSMGGVDKKDQFLQAFPLERIRNSVWYKKLFRRLLNVSIHNTYVIYSHIRKTSHRDFRMMLADEILKKHSPLQPPPPARAPSSGHFPLKVMGKARCRQCAKSKIDSRTSWACDACGTPLCVMCFKNYHTSEGEL